MNNQETEAKKIEQNITEPKVPVKVAQPVPNPIPASKEVTPKPGYENIMAENGVNLIPTLSKEEVIVAEKKKKLNVGSIVSLLILVVVSILIIGFNIVSRMALNSEQAKLNTYEAKVNKMTLKMISSNEITERIQLYSRVLSEAYSPKSVVDYVNAIASKSGTSVIDKFSLGQDLSFTIDGTTTDMENVSKFWYLLSNDPKIETVTLQSVGNNGNYVKFIFKGKLILKEFLNSTNN